MKTLRKIGILVCLLIIVLLNMGCVPYYPYGKVSGTVSAYSATKSINWTASPDFSDTTTYGRYYTVKISQDNLNIIQELDKTQEYSIDDLEVGTYDLSVDWYKTADRKPEDKIATATKELNVKTNIPTDGSIQLDWLKDGVGSLAITIKIPNENIDSPSDSIEISKIEINRRAETVLDSITIPAEESRKTVLDSITILPEESTEDIKGVEHNVFTHTIEDIPVGQYEIDIKYYYNSGTKEKPIFGRAAVVHSLANCESILKIVETKNDYLKYRVGDFGPAKGIVIYDCDADNLRGNADKLVSSTAGWRFLEATKTDLVVDQATGAVSLASDDTRGSWIHFGHYRGEDMTQNFYCYAPYPFVENGFDKDGNKKYILGKPTSPDIGKGLKNTEDLVKAMGDDKAFKTDGSYEEDQNKKVVATNGEAIYAAKVALDLDTTNDSRYEDFDDWYIPSIDELMAMYKNYEACIANAAGKFDIEENFFIKDNTGWNNTAHQSTNVRYWSSSEFKYNPKQALSIEITPEGDLSSTTNGRVYPKYVKAVRQF